MSTDNTSTGAVYSFFEWLKNNNDVTLYHIEASPDNFRRLIGADSTANEFNRIIKLYVSVTKESLHHFIDSGPTKDPNIDKCSGPVYAGYRLAKILWLADNIQKNGLKIPLQLQFFGSNCDGFQCHPGSDKSLAIDLLHPLTKISAFYIHYHHIPNSALPTYIMPSAKKITTPSVFLSLFNIENNHTFYFTNHEIILSDSNVPELVLLPDEPVTNAHENIKIFRESWNYKKNNAFPTRHMTYGDGLVRNHMDIEPDLLKELFAKIYLKDDNTFVFGDITFLLSNGIWITEQ
jgi:hypothetical protein